MVRLAGELPLPQLRVPFLFTGSIGPLELDTLSQALGRGIEALHLSLIHISNPPATVSMDGCSARMLEHVEAAVAAGDTAQEYA